MSMTLSWNVSKNRKLSPNFLPVSNVIKLFSVRNLDGGISPEILDDSVGVQRACYLLIFLCLSSFSEIALIAQLFDASEQFKDDFQCSENWGEIPTSRFPTEKSFITLGTGWDPHQQQKSWLFLFHRFLKNPIGNSVL